MENVIKFDLESVDITNIIEQIHENIEKRGYDMKEIKRLSSGVSISFSNISSPLGQRLNENIASVNHSHFVQYWWQIICESTIKQKLKCIVQKIVRKFSYFYMKHVIDQQNIHNANLTRCVNDLSEYCISLESEKNELFTKVNAIQKMLKESQQKIQTLEDISINQKSNGFSEKLCYDYNKFENKFRGSFSDIEARQKHYSQFFFGCKNVIDIGCGRGEFLNILKQAGINAIGLDLVEKNIELCIENDTNAKFGDGVDYLNNLADESIDGIFAAQVIEHMKTDILIKFIDLAYKKLEKGSNIVLETLNPQCLMIFAESMYLDPTHSTPVHPETIRFFLEQAGFQDVHIEFFSPSDPNLKMPLLSAYPEANLSINTLNNLIFGNREYAVIGKK